MCLQNFRRFGNFAGEIWRFEWKAKKMMCPCKKIPFPYFWTFSERIGIFWNGLQIWIPWHRFPIPRKIFRLKYWKMKKLGEEYEFQSQSNLNNFYFAPNFFIFQYFNLKFFLGIGNRCQGIRICNSL